MKKILTLCFAAALLTLGTASAQDKMDKMDGKSDEMDKQ
jgi:hypothetical protein